MKILYISQYFYPEMGAAAARVFEISRYWAALGHEVTVLTCFPNYPDGNIYGGYLGKHRRLYLTENIDGVNVVRLVTYPTHLRSSARRGLNYLSSLVTSSIAVPFLKKNDVVIGTSPPLFMGLPALFYSRLRGIPFVFEVRDLWPEVISAVGVGEKGSLTYKIFDRTASLLYDKSDLVVALTESFRETMINDRGVPAGKIAVIENAVDTDFFKPRPLEPGEINGLGLKGKFVVSYVGTIGFTHGVGVALKAAEELRTAIPELVFLFVGDGSDKERLLKIKEEKKLDNVIFTGKQPKEKIPEFLNASAVSLVLSTDEPLFRKTIFAKVFEPMACGNPVVIGAEGETRKIVERARSGIGFEPGSVKGLVDAVTTLYENPGMREEFGRNGRKFVEEEFSREKKAADYLKALEEVVRKKNSPVMAG